MRVPRIFMAFLRMLNWMLSRFLSLFRNTGPQLPTEIWVKIFDQVIMNEPTTNSLMQYRGVCKKWQDVIDNHYIFNVVIDDKEMDVTRLSNLRVHQCTIDNFLKKIPQNYKIFQEANHLTKLHILGDISSENFQKIITWATNAPEDTLPLEELSLGASVLLKAGILTSVFNKFGKIFLEKLKNLTNLTIDISYNLPWMDQSAALDNLGALLRCEIPKLQTFSLRAGRINCKEAYKMVTKSVIIFLGAHPNLIELDAHIYFMDTMINLPPISNYRQFPSIDLQEKLRQSKLETFNLSTESELLGIWLSVIKLLRSLKNLKMAVSDANVVRRGGEPSCLRSIGNGLINNPGILTSIELNLFVMGGQVDANVFARTISVNSLVFYSNCSDSGRRDPSIVNLRLLPVSIETLKIHGLIVDLEDFEEAAGRLEIIKQIELKHVGKVFARDSGMTQRILEQISERRNLNFIVAPSVESWNGGDYEAEGLYTFVLTTTA